MTSAELLAQLDPARKADVLQQLRHQGETAAAAKPKRSKFGAQPTEVDGIRFPSKREARRYTTLKTLRQVGEVLWFGRQPVFDLPGGVKYLADFVVLWKDGRVTVEDAKGMRTKEYRIKRRQVKACWGIDIEEV